MEYESQGEKMLKRVNELMAAREDISELLGMNPLYIMYDNNSNHLQFISNVIKLNDYDLLAKSLPWVYKTYTSRDFSVEFFPEVLKAWMKAIDEFLTPESAAQVIEVYLEMLDSHNAAVEHAQEGLIQMKVDEDWKAIERQTVLALLTGDYKSLERLLTVKSIAKNCSPISI